MRLLGRKAPTAHTLLCVLGLLLASSHGQSTLPEGCGDIISARGNSGAAWAVNGEGLEVAENSFQKVVNCVPSDNSLFLEMSGLTVQQTVNISSPVKIVGRTQEGEKVALRCNENQPLFDIIGSAVEISNIKVMGCQLSGQRAAIHVHEKSDIELKGVECNENLNTLGSACISVNSGVVRILDGQFRSNQGLNGGVLQAVGNSSVVIRDSKFISNAAFSAGGALNLQESDINISGTQFSKNTGNSGGGAIKGSGESVGLTLLITSSDFESNSAGNRTTESNGGAMLIDGPLASVRMTDKVGFISNKASNDGGGIYAKGIQRLAMSGGFFTSNSAENGKGSAIRLEQSDRLTLKSMRFNGNFGEGAALHVEANAQIRSKIQIEETEFEGNTGNGLNGGGVALMGHMDVEVAESTFDGNKASNGGAMLLFTAVTMKVSKCSFVANSALQTGGAIYAAVLGATTNSNLQFSDVRFVNNSAQSELSSGGALSLEGLYLEVNFLEKLLFKDNTADSGGAITMDGVAAVNMNDVAFESNYARKGAGGAIQAKDIKSFNCSKSTFKDNSGQSGGALSVQVVNTVDMDVSISEAQFESNTANTMDGGAISFEGRGTFLIQSSKFTECSSRNGGAVMASNVLKLSVASCDFEKNEASLNGGALGAQADEGIQGNLAILATTFVRNAAGAGSGTNESSGGAIYLSGQKFETELMNEVKFIENIAGTQGGALLGMGGKLTAKNVIFRNNSAQNGGACVLERIRFSLTSASFEKNSALKGGALILKGNTSSTDLYESTISGDILFNGNSASTEFGDSLEPVAGAMYVMQGTRLIMKKARFLGNTAVSGLAGAVAVEGNTDVIMENIVFESNSASRSGSLSVRKGAKCTIGGRSNFTENSARDQGGAIGISARSNLTLLGTYLKSNVADAGYGGAIGMKEIFPLTAECKISYTNFTANSARGPSIVEDSFGGALYLSGSVNLTQEGVNYRENNATGGGGIYATGSINVKSVGGEFLKNFATEKGGAIVFDTDTQSSRESGIKASTHKTAFRENIAGTYKDFKDTESTKIPLKGKGGAIFVQGAVIDLLFNGSVFYDNVASTGGAINWMNGRSLTLEMGEFHTNKAAVGGAIKAIVPQSAIDKLAISISNIAFRNNTALHGGAISVEGAFVSRNTDGDPNVKLERVRFSRNKAYNSCGAVAVRQTMMTVNQCNFTRNTAGYFGEERGSPGGSICASDLSRAYVNGSSFSRNSANVGGAMYVKDSILEVHKSEFNHNNATEGGGIAQTFHSASVPTNGALSSYTSSFLKHNSAFVGGGIHITIRKATSLSCDQLENPLESASLGVEDGNLEQDFERRLGACQNDVLPFTGRVTFTDTEFNNNLAKSGAAIFSNDPSALRICCDTNCTEDQPQLSKFPCNGTETGVSWKQDTAKGSIFSTTPATLEIDPPRVKDHTSGEELEVIAVKLVDKFGQEAISDDVTLTIRIKSPSGFEDAISGSAVTGVIISGGTANVSGIKLRASPGKYTLELSAKPAFEAGLSADLNVTVRPCRIGEVEKGDICTTCRGNFYSFDSKIECLPCPNDALCNASTLVPRNGFWQSTSWSPNVVNCLFKDACAFRRNGEERSVILANEHEAGALERKPIDFHNLSLCDQGYEDILCGSCAPGYGKVRSLECVKCQGKSSSLLGLVLVSIWLWLLAVMLIRKSLTWANEISTRGGRETMSGDRRDYEISKNRASEVAKIIINFFQTTGIAWSINQNWSHSILSLLLGLDTASGIAYGNVSSLDCLFGENRDTRTLLSIVVPMYVPVFAWIVFCIFWLGVASVKRMQSEDFINRTIISMLALLFVYFISTAKRLARLLYCIEVKLVPGEESNLVEVWAEDTRFKCFKSDHLRMLTIGAPMGFATCVIFPLWIIFLLKRNKHLFTSEMFIKRYGFLYKSYRPNAEFWEVVILARKAILAFIVVNSEPLGVDLQGTLAVGVLVIALIVHAHVRPFKKGLSRLNTLEFISLIISTLVFLSGLIFDSPKTTPVARIFLSIVVFAGITIFIVVLLLEMVFAGVKVLTMWAETHGFIDRSIGASQNCAMAVGVLRAHIQGIGRNPDSIHGLELVVAETADGVPATIQQTQAQQSTRPLPPRPAIAVGK